MFKKPLKLIICCLPLHDLEHLLDRNDQVPVSGLHLGAEALLQRVDGSAVHVAVEHRRLWDVAPDGEGLARLDLDRDVRTGAGHRHGGALRLDADNSADLENATVRLLAEHGRVGPQLALQHLDAENDGVRGTEDAAGDDLEGRGEHGERRVALEGLRFQCVCMLNEHVEELVDDIGMENLDVVLVGDLLGLTGDLHVKGQHDGVDGVTLCGDDDGEHVALVDRTQRNVCDGDTVLVQEAEESLERPERRGLNANAAAAVVEILHERAQILHDVGLVLLEVRVVVDNVERCAGDSLVEIVRGDLAPHGGLDFLVVHVLATHAELLARLRRHQGTHGGHDGAVEAAAHNAIAEVELAVHQNDIERCALPLRLLDLEHGALQLAGGDDLLLHEFLNDLHEQR
eukprot:PhM_4_TR10238/c0_g1_i1/m.89028